MRRIAHRTTAIVASLALLAPQFAMAEQRLPDTVVAQQRPIRAENMPRLNAMLQEELSKGLRARDLICANGAPRPCPDGVRLLTPGGVTVQVSQSGALMLAPGPQQVNIVNPAGRLVPRVSDVTAIPDPQANEAAEEAAKDERKAAERARKEAEKAARKAARQAAETAAAGAAARAAPKPAPRAEAAVETAVRDALARARGPIAGAGAGIGALSLAQGQTAQYRFREMPGLAGVLRSEVDAGLTRDKLTCQTGPAARCPEGAALLTPRGVAVTVSQNGVMLMLPAARQPNAVNGQGQIVPRAPEAGTVETAAAQEAAKEVSAPAAAALAAAEGAGRIVNEQRLTRDNTRSSADDFETSLRQALARAGAAAPVPQQTDAGDGKDGKDLAKALILGLGAVAVGQMLNNNREVALSTPDRVVVQRPDGSQEVIKDEVALLRQPGSTVTTEDFDDGSSRTIVTRADGSKVVTIRDADLRVLRRTLISADGKSTMLIDDTADVQPVDVAHLPAPAQIPATTGDMTEDQLRDALSREASIDRRFTLGQIRNIPEVRALVAPVNIDAITFDSGSAAIKPDQARQLASLGQVIQKTIARNPREIFMVEGYTDTVGADAMNLALSDRRAESVALALSEYFKVPPENLVVQGYGEQFLKVRAEGDIRANRRASLRRITDLLQTAQAN